MVTKTSRLPISYLLALLWAHPILHVSRIRVKEFNKLHVGYRNGKFNIVEQKTVLWDVNPRSLAATYESFGSIRYLCLQVEEWYTRINWVTDVDKKKRAQPWRRREYVPPKLQWLAVRIDGVTSQKRVRFMFTAVRTSSHVAFTGAHSWVLFQSKWFQFTRNIFQRFCLTAKSEILLSWY